MKYPVYVISKGRAKSCLTSKFLRRDGVEHKVVVEPQEEEAYAENVGPDVVTVLPFSNLGQGSIPARNWCWEHAKKEGHARHWILDDNIRRVRRLYRGRRIPCASEPAFAAVEDFVERYENLAVAGLNYTTFQRREVRKPFVLNVHVYSCLLIDCSIEQRWRGRYNEDTDLCLQVLAAGMCTALVNIFGIEKMHTMTMKGGNTEELYRGDGRLEMARSLERRWPGVVKTSRRFKRPQHVVAWSRFKNKLKRRPGVDLSKLEKVDERGLKLRDRR